MAGGSWDSSGALTWRFSRGSAPTAPTWTLINPTTIPQRRRAASSWMDKNGDLCMYGGTGAGNLIYQPLRYSLGTATVPNWEFQNTDPELVRSMAATSWTDRKGHFWMFGGLKPYPEDGYYNDLYRLKVLQPKPLNKITTPIDTPIAITVPVNDFLGDASIFIDSLPGHGSASLLQNTTNTVVYFPNPGFGNIDTFRVGVTNGRCSPEYTQLEVYVGIVPGDLNGDGFQNSMDEDTDGDGFPNPIETALGTDPDSFVATPTGEQSSGFSPIALTKQPIKGKIHKKTGLDKISLKGSFTTTENNLALSSIAADVGSNPMLFILDAKGKKAVSSSGAKLSCKLKKSKTGGPSTVTFSLKLNQNLRSNMASNFPVDENSNPTRFSLNLFALGKLYTALQQIQFK